MGYNELMQGVQRINAAFLMLTILLLPVYAYYITTYITTGEWVTTN